MYRCFFFFKQKTAYEMRISDWSSDVCSSDLARATPPRPDAVLARPDWPAALALNAVDAPPASVAPPRAAAAAPPASDAPPVAAALTAPAPSATTPPAASPVPTAAPALRCGPPETLPLAIPGRSEEHTSELQSLM